MAPTSNSHLEAGKLARLLDAAADIYAAPGDSCALAISSSLRAARSPAVQVPSAQPPALEYLSLAMAAIPSGPMAESIRDCAALLPWTDQAFSMPGKLAGGYAFVEVAGPDGLALCEELRFGLYLQSPGIFYPPHSHAAEELYHVVSGTAEWQKDDGEFLPQAPGASIYHAPWQGHATQTGRDALLALWVWTGNLDAGTYRVHD